MMKSTGRLNFPGAVVWFSYGKPTKIDAIGCDGAYVRKVVITNVALFLLYSFWVRLWK